MKITTLGTRGYVEPSGPYHSRYSGILVDDTLLFDVGEPEFLMNKPQAIFITHLHPDHAYFVDNNNKKQLVGIPIFAPEKYPGIPINVLTKKMNWGKYTITPIPTEHSVKIKSQAYLIEKNSERILYTGDMFWIKKKYHKILHNLDLVITEASFMREGGIIRRSIETNDPYGHAGVPNLIRLFKPFTNNIAFTHFGSWFYRAGAAKARKQLHLLAQKYEINIYVCYDGMQIDTTKL